jgi:hypothetical protein
MLRLSSDIGTMRPCSGQDAVAAGMAMQKTNAEQNSLRFMAPLFCVSPGGAA